MHAVVTFSYTDGCSYTVPIVVLLLGPRVVTVSWLFYAQRHAKACCVWRMKWSARFLFDRGRRQHSYVVTSRTNRWAAAVTTEYTRAPAKLRSGPTLTRPSRWCVHLLITPSPVFVWRCAHNQQFSLRICHWTQNNVYGSLLTVFATQQYRWRRLITRSQAVARIAYRTAKNSMVTWPKPRPLSGKFICAPARHCPYKAAYKIWNL